MSRRLGGGRLRYISRTRAMYASVIRVNSFAAANSASSWARSVRPSGSRAITGNRLGHVMKLSCDCFDMGYQPCDIHFVLREVRNAFSFQQP
jgi:hypothetical protein